MANITPKQELVLAALDLVNTKKTAPIYPQYESNYTAAERALYGSASYEDSIRDRAAAVLRLVGFKPSTTR